MAMASPTPMGSSHFGPRRPASRQTLRQLPSRPGLSRQNALPPSAPALHGRQYSLGDSSDDDIAPPTFNKATNRLLGGGEHSILDHSSPVAAMRELQKRSHTSADVQRSGRAASADIVDLSREKTASPFTRNNSPHPSKRIVRLSSTPGSLRRTSSLSNTVQRYEEHQVDRESPVETPAQVKRTVRIPTGSSFRRSGSGSSSKPSSRLGSGQRGVESDQEPLEEPVTVARNSVAISHGSVTRYGNFSRSRYGDDTGVPRSTFKRVGGDNGARKNLMRVAPRRGRRRQSEEDQEQGEENKENLDSHFESQESQHQEPRSAEGGMEEWIPDREPEVGRASHFVSQRGELSSGSPLGPVRRAESPVPTNSLMEPMQAYQQMETMESPIPQAQPIYRLPVPKPEMPSVHDQENEAPPTFKRNRPTGVSLLDKIEQAKSKPEVHEIQISCVETSPSRKALAPRSQNTPRRPAPPPPGPPKMSVLETATATAGAATSSNTSKKRSAVKVNGKVFTRLDVLGRGGSSKVWRVMADNGKFFALKKVNLEAADDNAIRGFRAERDLLLKLKDNDRVIRLMDYEENHDKQTLSVLMEMGELDFNKMLVLRFNSEDHPAVFDSSFTRHYWKEMLECLQAVHDLDVVHSDLKPANFVLVQGRLKLIDFGIANAIQTDETVNVHRDHQIGTPNYMAPESLMESNEMPRNGMHSSGPKIWKIGKPSDIWSLGCILYQMSYGRQPFSHIQNQLSKCRAIIDFNYPIDFPAVGLGGVRLPTGLINTMKKCLNRDQHLRPTVEELLRTTDPFLYPIEYEDGAIPMTEELLGRILQSVAAKCQDRMPTEAELLKVWPAGYFASLRKSM